MDYNNMCIYEWKIDVHTIVVNTKSTVHICEICETHSFLQKGESGIL